MENTRNTIQKKIIFNTLKEMKEHPSAQEVYEEVHGKHSTISRATVFRVLNNLAEAGHLFRIKIPGCADCYDYKTINHYHIKCSECNKISNMDSSFLEDPIIKANEYTNYKITGYTLIFEGICNECQKNNNYPIKNYT